MRLAIRGLSALDLRSCSASEEEEDEEDDREETEALWWLLLVMLLVSLFVAGGMAGTGAVPGVALVKLAMLQRALVPPRKTTFFVLLFSDNFQRFYNC